MTLKDKNIELFKLWDSNDIVYAENSTHDECWEHIKNYAKKHNLGYYYRNNLLEDNLQKIDYGSHTHFFYLKSITTLDDHKELYKVLHDGTAYVEEEEETEEEIKNLSTLFKDYNDNHEPILAEDKKQPISLHVTGIENVAKLIESLTEKNGFYEFRVWTDEYQAYLKAEQRSYTIEIANRNDAEKFLFDSEYNW